MTFEYSLVTLNLRILNLFLLHFVVKYFQIKILDLVPLFALLQRNFLGILIKEHQEMSRLYSEMSLPLTGILREIT